MKQEGFDPNPWVLEMLNKGIDSFYNIENGSLHYYDITSGKELKIPGQDAFIILDNIREAKTIWNNNEASIQHLGDGIC